MERLTGADLLLAIRAVGSLSRAQWLRITGYVRLQQDGREQLDNAAFHQALLEAARAAASPAAAPAISPVAIAGDSTSAAPSAGGSPNVGQGLHPVKEQIVQTLVKTVIALPLLDRINAEHRLRQQGDATPAAVHEVISACIGISPRAGRSLAAG